MKKIARLIMLAAVVAAMAAGCQKEDAAKMAANTAVGPRQVEYSVDGVSQHVTAKDEAEWQALLAGSFDDVDAGHLVNLSHNTGTNPAKENIVYSTDSREAAQAWVDARFNEGYDVTMWYDSENGKYICVASKVAPPANVAPNGFVYQPLQQYLPGYWTLCLDHQVTLAPGASSISLDPNLGILSMTWEQIYSFYEIVPGAPRANTYNDLIINSDTIRIGKDTIPYVINSQMVYAIVNMSRSLYADFRAYEWSYDTMLVYYRNASDIYPLIYTRN